MRLFLFIVSFLGMQELCYAQNQDTLVSLENIEVRGYDNYRTPISLPASISKVQKRDFERFGNISLVPAFNTIPGIRMEERSPGSYRLSIRGSLLRSPFGVRNIKIYWKDLPLTDAGGNSYLNLMDVNGIGNAEILKGPASSTFGSGTGGVITLSEPSLNRNKKNEFLFQLGTGSFGTFNTTVQALGSTKNAEWHIMQSHLNSSGYRDNSSLKREVSQANLTWAISGHHQIDAILLYSNLEYKTPGGLTLAQMKLNPRMSRPASGNIPSAIQQHAGVFNETFISGITDKMKFGKNWSSTNSIILSYTNFKNPFITNFEKRRELNFAIRSSLKYSKIFNQNSVNWNTGIESQIGNYQIDSSGNNAGISDIFKVRDHVNAGNWMLFSQIDLQIKNKWVIQAGLSLNEFHYFIRRIAPVQDGKSIKFEKKAMPRISLLYQLKDDISIYSSISKGYSTPTLAEIIPSASGIYTGLQAEFGYNLEFGIKSSWLSNRLKWDLNVFEFKLKDAIVRKTNDVGQEYFMNAGGTNQKGIESGFTTILFTNKFHWLNEIRLTNNVTLYDFKFDDYINGGVNYSGNKLTGVPDKTIVALLDIKLKNGIYSNLTYQYTSSIPLNDKNEVFADDYSLWQIKLGYKLRWRSVFLTDIYTGIDNIGNELYSLGNDINAFGKRFFNPAPGRNYYVGLKLVF